METKEFLIDQMDSLHVRLTFNLAKTNCQVWWRNVVKHGKYSLAKFANLYVFVLREEKVTTFQLKTLRG